MACILDGWSQLAVRRRDRHCRGCQQRHQESDDPPYERCTLAYSHICYCIYFIRFRVAGQRRRCNRRVPFFSTIAMLQLLVIKVASFLRVFRHQALNFSKSGCGNIDISTKSFGPVSSKATRSSRDLRFSNRALMRRTAVSLRPCGTMQAYASGSFPSALCQTILLAKTQTLRKAKSNSIMQSSLHALIATGARRLPSGTTRHATPILTSRIKRLLSSVFDTPCSSWLMSSDVRIQHFVATGLTPSSQCLPRCRGVSH